MAMEHFDDMQTNRPREKSVYLLHLDTPRIIIIACALVGILIIAFLIGMNFSGEERTERHMTAGNEALFAPLPDEPAREGSEIHAMDRPNDADNTDKPTAAQSLIPAVPDQKASQTVTPAPQKESQASPEKAVAQKSDKEGRDLLTQDSVGEIIPPSKAVRQEKKNQAPRSITRGKKHTESPARSSKRKQHKTVEVSSKEIPAERISREGFSVQVAAYSSRAKALQEVNRLKEHRYDPYIENTRLNGKNFFRVKIGPLSNRKEAVKILEELKEMNRYEHSYITGE